MNSVYRFVKKEALTFGALLLVPVLISSCSSGKAEKNKPSGIPVSVGAVVSKNVPLQIVSIGNVEAYNTISVEGHDQW